MEKICHSSSTSGDSITSSSTNNNNNNTSIRQNPSDHFLKHLNKISHKISKQPIGRKPPPPPLDHHNSHHQNQNQNQSFQNQSQNQSQNLHQQQPQQQSQTQSQNQELQNQHNQQLQQQQQQQPPVYNINKSDFRDVVQKLTGSPAHHDRFSTPPPIQPPKPPSSRLHRIRPPPLQPPRPTSPLNNAAAFIPQPQPPLPNTNPNFNNSNSNNPGSRQVTPLSPLPPFPSVHGAAESPISAYMRYLQSTTPTLDSESKKFTGFSSVPPIISPKWNNQPNSFFQQQQQQFLLPSPNSMANSQFRMPNSPLGFGLLSPSMLFSPTSGQLGFPQLSPSPRLPLLSPRWRGV
ncbi:hypothetical protein MKX01_009680 [Papaver californicum]|nr:hypothetical protein MKX01_009680 [Papaver californicum]